MLGRPCRTVVKWDTLQLGWSFQLLLRLKASDHSQNMSGRAFLHSVGLTQSHSPMPPSADGSMAAEPLQPSLQAVDPSTATTRIETGCCRGSTTVQHSTALQLYSALQYTSSTIPLGWFRLTKPRKNRPPQWRWCVRPKAESVPQECCAMWGGTHSHIAYLFVLRKGERTQLRVGYNPTQSFQKSRRFGAGLDARRHGTRGSRGLVHRPGGRGPRR